MTPEENDLITRVEGDAPMGKLLQQNHWIPAERAARLEPGGAPLRVRLFGRNFVVWRADDGRVGFFDEACPHRRASLALARNEGNALTCIFHGWRFDVSGRVTAVPTQATKPDEFAARVPLKNYPVREAGGIVWVWIGKGANEGAPPPQFPDFQFTKLAPHQVVVASSVIDCNWVQGVEAVVDAAHVGILHANFLNKFVGYAKLTAVAPPVYDIDRQNYGFRAAALRDLGDGTSYVRINEFVMPWYGFTSPNDPKLPHRTLFLSVPVDDTHARQWFLRYNVEGEGDKEFGFGLKNYDPDNFTPFADGPDKMWGQDRAAMKQGSFSGFGDNVLTEDMVVQLSMGPITDRSEEFLSEADLAIVHMRRLLLQSVRDWQAGRNPVGAGPGIDYANIRATGGIVPKDKVWRDVLPKGASDSLEAQRAATASS